MSLFVVNRYLGEENDAEHNSSSKGDRSNIDTLLSKIEERRKLREKKLLEKRSPEEVERERKEKKKEKRRQARLKKAEANTEATGESTAYNQQHTEVPLNGDGQKGHYNNRQEQSIPEFTVIGNHGFKKTVQIRSVLPEWVARPVKISSNLKSLTLSVDEIPKLDKVLVNNLRKNKISHFFPVQSEVIPWLLTERNRCNSILKLWPRDICVSAPTGSGKTLAFVLPVLQGLRKHLVRRIRALVVLPVQDLAAQVARVFAQYSVGTGLKVLTVTGKAMPFQREQELLIHRKTGVGLESRVDIVVTTPGRLVEHLKETPGFDLRHLQYLIIDEADRVIKNIKNDWIYHLENHLSSTGVASQPSLSVNTLSSRPLRPQKLLFSATLTQDPEKLKQLNLFQPRLFTCTTGNPQQEEEGEESRRVMQGEFVGRPVLPCELEQKWVVSSDQMKPLVLYHVLATEGWRGVLVFTHFTDATHRLARLLSLLSAASGLGLSVGEISSEVSYSERNDVVHEFTTGKIDVLVCSDAFARGMDIMGVHYVVLYSPPKHIENYIHQVGRTARAGTSGTALTILTQTQVRPFRTMLKTSINRKIEEVKIKESDLSYLEEPYSNSLYALKNEATAEKQTVKEKLKYVKRKRRRDEPVKSSAKKKRRIRGK